MQVSDPDRLFEAAQRAFSSARYGEAHGLLDQLDRLWGEHCDLLHLRALVLKGERRHDDAERMFAAADRLRPSDPQILTNWGNLLTDAGEAEAALVYYDRAVSADPGFAEAHYNWALALQRLTRLQEALEVLDGLLARPSASSAKLHSARGAVLMALERPQEAIAAFDRALAIEPERAVALTGRATLALKTGAPDSVERHIAALQRSPGDRALILGVVQAMREQGDPSGLDILQDVLRQDPSWLEGHHELALLRAEAGHGDAFVEHIREAIAAHSADARLYQTLAAILTSADRHADALNALSEGQRACGPQPDWAFELARLEGECGDRAAAWQRLAALPDSDLARQVRGRLGLRLGRADEAAVLLEELVTRSPADMAGWAYLSLAWRMTGDARHAWLAEQPGLWSTADLDLDDEALRHLADVLRAIHASRAHPVGQSLRGGTQTRGRLFWRREPELAMLASLLRQAVADYVASLPLHDPRHPLLRHRHDNLHLAGSWSVRLTDGGFHVHHIHPQGAVSSACYIVLPPASTDDECAGWLEIGGAPSELDLKLDPLALVEPSPGRLALFPSYLFHGTRPFPRGERLTVAFDVVAAGKGAGEPAKQA